MCYPQSGRPKSHVISKTFVRLAQAEAFQDELYDEWESVRLVRSPMFEESGVYAWEVSRAELVGGQS